MLNLNDPGEEASPINSRYSSTFPKGQSPFKQLRQLSVTDQSQMNYEMKMLQPNNLKTKVSPLVADGVDKVDISVSSRAEMDLQI